MVLTVLKALTGTLSLSVKREGSEADRSPSSSPGVKNVCYCNSTATCAFITRRRVNLLSPLKSNLVLVHAMRLCGGLKVEVYSFSISRLHGERDNLHAPTALPYEEESLIIECCI